MYSPAADRNKDPICAVMKEFVPSGAKVLELASGTGQHALYLSEKLQVATWQPTDYQQKCLDSINAYLDGSDSEKLCKPAVLDVTAHDWGLDRSFDFIYAANLIHISPWKVTESLFSKGRNHLQEKGSIVLYGPYFEEGVETARSNYEFDDSLRQSDPEWGIRKLEDVKKVAKANGFHFSDRWQMPANNLIVKFDLSS